VTHLEAYLELKREFEAIDAGLRQAAFALTDLAERMLARADRPLADRGLQAPGPGECAAMIARRAAAWTRLNLAWQAMPDDLQRELAPPRALRPTPHPG
jgi:hypothetical protein